MIEGADFIELKVGGSLIKMTPTNIVTSTIKKDIKGSAIVDIKGSLVKINTGSASTSTNSMESQANVNATESHLNKNESLDDASLLNVLQSTSTESSPYGIKADVEPIMMADAGAYSATMTDAVAVSDNADITTEQLEQIFPDASNEILESTRDAFNESYDKFNIDTPLRKAHFFAQVREEVGSDITLVENLNYSATALPTQFSAYRATDENGNTIRPYAPNNLANQHGRSAANDWVVDQDAIADNAYANRMGNGDAESGDGSRYKGQGFIQLTGRNNYEAVNDEIQDKLSNSGIDIVNNENDIKTTRGSMISAMAYWSMNDINTVADQGSEGSDADAVTDIVNSGTSSRPERRAHLETTKNVFNIE